MMFALIIYGIALGLILAVGITFFVHLFFMVPFVPSTMRVTKKMIEAAELKDGEHVYDLGCGDGRILIAAQRAKKVHVVGFELAPLVYLLARVRLWAAKCRAQLHLKSFYKAQLQNADVIFCYLFPEVMEKLREKFFAECKPGTRIISHTFRMHGVEPYQVFPQDKKTGMPSIYVYKI